MRIRFKLGDEDVLSHLESDGTLGLWDVKQKAKKRSNW